jgi:hypothetical protein
VHVWWAGSVVGDYLAFAHIVADDENNLGGLQDFIDTNLWNNGVRCQKAIELLTAKGKGTKHTTPDILALVGIKTQHGRTMSVMEQLDRIDDDHGGDWLKGCSLVTGRLDILLQLNARSLKEALRPLTGDEFTGIEGISWTSTAIADGSRRPFGDS